MPQAADLRRNGGPRVSIRDIARDVGVSTATVSAFLSGKRPVSAATKARLEVVIKTRGYRVMPWPWALARAYEYRTNTPRGKVAFSVRCRLHRLCGGTGTRG